MKNKTSTLSFKGLLTVTFIMFLLTITTEINAQKLAPGVPALVAPTSNSNVQCGKSVQFTWNAPTGATPFTYTVYIYNGTSWSNYSAGSNLYYNYLVSETGGGSLCGAGMQWYVHVTNAYGSNNSSTWNFTPYPKYSGSTADYSITPTTSCQSTGAHSITASTAKYYSFSATAGYTYYVGTCNTGMGCGTNTTWDTYLRIYGADNSCTTSAYDDDGGSCGNGTSYIAWTCSTSGTYYLQLTGKTKFTYGTYYLQYKYTCPTLTAGSIGSNQSICYNTSPAAFTQTAAPTGGTGSYTYQWQNTTVSGCGSGWGNISGATATTYQAPALTATTCYRRVVTSGSCGTANSNTITVTVYGNLTAGSVGSNQSICYNTSPSLFTQTVAPTGGTGSYTYQWQSTTLSGCGGWWGNISGATATTYQAPALTTTTCYRRNVISGSCGMVSSSAITATVYANLTSGSVGSNQSICYNTSPAAFTQTAAPTGGTGSYTYQWQQQPGCSGGWSNISGTTASTYNYTGNLTQTTCYRRNVTSGSCGTVSSSAITVTVYANLTSGNVGSNQSICYNTSSAAFTQTAAPTGGTGSYTYQWQSTTVSGCGSGWSNISGATATTYNYTGNLTQTTCYRRNVTSGSCGTVSSGAITVTVYALPLADAGTDTIIFAGDSVQIGSSPIGGNTYEWSPVSGLSSTTVANPWAKPLHSQIYYLTAYDANGCFNSDSIIIFTSEFFIDSSITYLCGSDADFFKSLAVYDTLQGKYSTSADQFPPQLIEYCGVFAIYYEDLNTTNNAGFADLSVGTVRRNTLCAVLDYIQNVFDFTSININNNEYIRIYVDESYDPVINPAPVGTTYLGKGGPYFHDIQAPQLVNGFVFDYMNTGADPTTTDKYHGYLQINFHKTYNTFGSSSPIIPWWNDYSQPIANCKYDLYSVLLHEVGHILGWFSLIGYTDWQNDNTPVSKIGNDQYTFYDFSLHKGSNQYPLNLQKIVDGTQNQPYLNQNFANNPNALLNNDIWLGANPAPDNHPVYSGRMYIYWPFAERSVLSHIDEQMYSYSLRSRISPGNNLNYVMVPFAEYGDSRRVFTIPELKKIEELGFTYTGNSNLNNLPPYSTKMAGYNNILYYTFPEDVAADFSPLINNIGTSLVINLWDDITLKDPENDQISIVSGSLTNIRGCGNIGLNDFGIISGNNHNSLVLSNNNQTITYTPRSDFWGRAQFGFNIWDGEHEGSYVFYTIDVLKGTNVSCNSNNLIINGDLEAGTEVKRLGAEEMIISSNRLKEYREGKIRGGIHFADAHPYNFVTLNSSPGGSGDLVKQSAIICNGNNTKHPIGIGLTSFPMFQISPDASGTIGQRYRRLNGLHNYFNLCTEMVQYQKYSLKFDYYFYNGNPNITLPLTIGFTNDAVFPNIPMLTHNSIHNINLVPNSWTEVTIPFIYCGNDPADILVLQATLYEAVYSKRFYIDNLVLTEEVNPPLSVNITSSYSPTICEGQNITLEAVVSNPLCNTLYSWQPGNETTQSIVVSPTTATTYTVTVTDDLGNTATDYIVVDIDPNCFCNGINIITQNNEWDSNLSLNSNVPLYSLIDNVTVTGNVVLENISIVMDADISITIGPSASLTLNNCHLYACTHMWQGIIVEPDGSLIINDANSTGTTLIEDAYLAVDVNTPNTSTLLLVDDAIFNRNLYAIKISDYPNTSTTPYTNFVVTNSVFTGRDMFTHPSTLWPSVSDFHTLDYSGDLGEQYSFGTFDKVNLKQPLTNKVASVGVSLINVGQLRNGTIYCEALIDGNNGNTTFNIFDNLLYGISGINSNFTSTNNVFQNIIADPQSSNGRAIYAENQNIGTNEYQINVLDFNKFYDCSGGIHVVGYNDVYLKEVDMRSTQEAISDEDLMQQGDVGIYVRTPYCNMVEIKDNTITNIRNGIVFIGDEDVNAPEVAQSIGDVTIDNNTIQANLDGINGDPQDDEYALNGIYAYSVANMPLAITGYTGNIIVSNNHLYQVHNGIYMHNWFYDPGTNENLAITENNYILLRERVYEPDPQQPILPELQYGIAHDVNWSPAITDNYVEGFGTAQSFWHGIYCYFNTGYAFPDEQLVSCNHVKLVGTGIKFDGDQSNTIFENNEMENNARGYVLDGAKIGQQGDATYACGNIWTNFGSGTFKTFTLGVTTGFGPTDSELYVIYNSNQHPQTPFNGTNGGTNDAYDDSNGIESATNNNPNSCGAKSQNTGNLSNAVVTDIIPWLELIALDSVSYATFDTEQRISAKHNLYRILKVHPFLMDNSSILKSFYIGLQNSNIATLANTENAMASGLSGNALSLNAGITPQNTIEENYKNFYTLYLNYRQGNFSTSDSLMLLNLVNGCVPRDGIIVQRARGFYSMIYNDFKVRFDGCPVSISSKGSTHTENISKNADERYFNLYPNPNTGSMTLEYMLEKDESGIMVINDIASRSVAEYTLNANNNTVVINENRLKNGIYYYSIYVNGVILRTDRIVIIK